MITKQEQEILLNAPSDATEYKHWHESFGAGVLYGCNMGGELLADLRKRQGKTVWDAVNYFKAKISLSKIKYICYRNGYWTNHGGNKEPDGLICTIEEFNQCVDDLAKFANKDKSPCYNYDTHKKHNLPQPIKPRTKVEYVAVDSNEAAYYFTETDYKMYPSPNKNIKPISLQDYINGLAIDDDVCIYRKVEVEITWQDELSDHIKSAETICGNMQLKLFESFCDNSVESAEFIEMCHLVSSMNK